MLELTISASSPTPTDTPLATGPRQLARMAEHVRVVAELGRRGPELAGQGGDVLAPRRDDDDGGAGLGVALVAGVDPSEVEPRRLRARERGIGARDRRRRGVGGQEAAELDALVPSELVHDARLPVVVARDGDELPDVLARDGADDRVEVALPSTDRDVEPVGERVPHEDRRIERIRAHAPVEPGIIELCELDVDQPAQAAPVGRPVAARGRAPRCGPCRTARRTGSRRRGRGAGTRTPSR